MKRTAILAVLILLGMAMVYSQDSGSFPGVTGGNSNKARERADDAMDKMEGLIPMRFFNALNRNPISGATVQIPNIGSYVTDSKGKIILPKIPDGNYTLTFSKEEYITTLIFVFCWAV